MKKLIKWAQKKVKKMDLKQLALLKSAVFIAGIVLGSFIPTFVQQYLPYFIATFIILYAILLCKVFPT